MKTVVLVITSVVLSMKTPALLQNMKILHLLPVTQDCNLRANGCFLTSNKNELFGKYEPKWLCNMQRFFTMWYLDVVVKPLAKEAER